MRNIYKKNLQKFVVFINKEAESSVEKDEKCGYDDDNYINNEYKVILKDSLDFNKKYIYRK